MMAGGQTLVVASARDTVKIFDTAIDSGDPCILQYVPSSGFSVNSVRWNHTNLVVASAGDDKRISLWRKNGQNFGTIPLSSGDVGDNIDESILSISFSNKSSRYLCTGGSGEVVKIWDLQRKRCIKWLKGHTGTITGVAYTCRDEHLASISVKGDLILHNLASGARTTEFKDPNSQVLRVLDYSRTSRHLLVTAGDDGSIILWDTNGRNRKASWLRQHSAPTTGVCFSPSNDKMISSCGLDKKIYTFDSVSRRTPSVVSFEAPFSSLAFRDDGRMLAAGTNNGYIVFYDVRGKMQPVNLLRAYNSSEAISSLCWQRTKPVVVNESSCTLDTALLGDIGEDSILMPDPLPSLSSSAHSSTMGVFGLRNSGWSSSGSDTSFVPVSSGTTIAASFPSAVEETPLRSNLWAGGALSRLHTVRAGYNFKDDMEVFSPLVDVQPITPSLSSWHDDAKNDYNDKKSSSLLPSASFKRYAHHEDGINTHPVFDMKSDSSSRQEDTQGISPQSAATPLAATLNSSDQSFSATPPEEWGADGLSDVLPQRHRRPDLSSSHVPLPVSSSSEGKLSSIFRDSQDPASLNLPGIVSTPTTSSKAFQMLGKDSSSCEMPPPTPSDLPLSGLGLSSSVTSNLTKTVPGQASYDLPGSISMNLLRKQPYLERLLANHSSGDGATPVGSPKLKKIGTETREDIVNSLLSKVVTVTGNASGSASASGMDNLPTMANGGYQHPQKGLTSTDEQHGTPSFSLQLVQHAIEETLESLNRANHEDVRNLHIEMLRQFYMLETKTTSLLNTILENQVEIMKKLETLQKENEQLRQLL